ncbi:Mss4-like protein [Mycena rosella]|uniref:Mss4-like protein n=1 Tax=Mycena rosella TaxID=1033263 RepID=A0AAD7C9R2_MYCRO|nr:Mss4-like protein [Mycena rosella]
MADSPLVTYRGNCHCGAFKFTVKLPELKTVYACDCSLCSRNAYLWARPELKAHFVVEKGEGALKDYVWGNRTMAHKFCPTCGTSVMCYKNDQPESETILINVRALADIDLEALQVEMTHGGALEPLYRPPQHEVAAPTDPSVVAYTGNCHCGAVAYTLHSTPLSLVKSCNCSICSRDGVAWIYPQQKSLTVHSQDSLVEYTYGRFRTYHAFCGTCGVAVWERFQADPPRTDIGLNVRTMNGLDWSTLTVEMLDRKDLPPLYKRF